MNRPSCMNRSNNNKNNNNSTMASNIVKWWRHKILGGYKQFSGRSSSRSNNNNNTNIHWQSRPHYWPWLLERFVFLAWTRYGLGSGGRSTLLFSMPPDHRSNGGGTQRLSIHSYSHDEAYLGECLPHSKGGRCLLPSALSSSGSELYYSSDGACFGNVTQ